MKRFSTMNGTQTTLGRPMGRRVIARSAERSKSLLSTSCSSSMVSEVSMVPGKRSVTREASLQTGAGATDATLRVRLVRVRSSNASRMRRSSAKMARACLRASSPASLSSTWLRVRSKSSQPSSRSSARMDRLTDGCEV